MLAGLRVVEFASSHAAMAGKLLGDLGAEVILVEPPDGHASRWFAPFVTDTPGVERSLWWHHYNTSKRGIVIDPCTDSGHSELWQLLQGADVVLEGEAPGRLEQLGLDYEDVRRENRQLVWVSVTPFGRSHGDQAGEAIDLTLMAEGGAMWSCGYDDHDLPPVRGGGNQAYQLGAVWAVKGA